jgi:N-acetylglucosaminyldiphosphoundecaprenol N-acetyl-beta-D-mannosaminyltransferase
MSDVVNKIDIAGLKVDAITKKELLDGIINRIKTGQKTFVITPYSEFLYYSFQDPKLLEIFNRADFSVADGIGLFWAKRFLEIPLTAKSYWGKILQAAWQIKYTLAAIIFYPRWIKSALPEKIVGADLIWDLAKLAADNNLSVYLLGGYGDTPQFAAEKLSVAINRGRGFNEHLKIVGCSNKNSDDATVVDDINKTNSDLLFVAYGPVKQEKWIANNLFKLNVKFAIGLGGSFDYIAGKKSAPPKFIRYSGMEWLWRLVTQPYRAKRIFHATFGLAWGLWHYKVFADLPYRKNVVCAVVNKKNEIFIAKFNPGKKILRALGYSQDLFENFWQFPQGGMEENENVVETAKRELGEETGIQNISYLKTSEKTYFYDWQGLTLRPLFVKKRYQYRGQTQHIVYFKFNGPDSEINLDLDELTEYKWVGLKNLAGEVHPQKQDVAKIIQEDLKDLA